MADITAQQRKHNFELLWDLRRNIRYAAKRAGWFESVHRFSCLLSFLCGSGAFASFAGHWPVAGYCCAALVTLIAAICSHYDYPKKAALFRTLRSAYLRVLRDAECAGGEAMPEEAWRTCSAAYRNVEIDLEEPVPTTLYWLMTQCENEVAACDMETECAPVGKVPRHLGPLIHLISGWKIKAKTPQAE